jgi:hypothetical protein
VEVRVQLGGALDVAGEQARGSVVYPAGHAAGDVLLRPTLGAVEDFVLVRTDETKHLDYDVELGADVAGLRLVEDTLELLDATGDPRLRAAPPYVVDANGEKRTAHLNVSGCSYDTDPSAPWGRSVTAPGASSCRVSVDWDSAGLKYPLLVDPAWTTTTAMGTARSHFMLSGPSSSTGSTKNLVLAAGGINASRAVIASAELYNPSSQTWTATASMIFPREDGIVMNRSQTKASVGDDYVLVAGGTSNTSAERYNFKNGTWALTGAMSTSRTSFAAANSDTDKVLVTGGYLPGNCNGGLCVRNTGEIYSFATNAWTASASPTEARFGHTLTRMTDGFGTGVIMVAGGRDQAMALVALTRKYTASSNSWASAGNLSKAAAWHTATWCSPNCAQNGLYVIGGAGASGAVQFYNASANSWSSIGTMYSSTQKIDFSHGAVYYSDSSNVGRILVAGGYTTDAKTLSYTNWATWPAFTQGSMFAARSSFGMSRLANGKVLVAGGDQGANSMTAAADLFTP